jgi:hypothetical protein
MAGSCRPVRCLNSPRGHHPAVELAARRSQLISRVQHPADTWAVGEAVADAGLSSVRVGKPDANRMQSGVPLNVAVRRPRKLVVHIWLIRWLVSGLLQVQAAAVSRMTGACPEAGRETMQACGRQA